MFALLMATARGLHLAAVLLTFGSLLVGAIVLPSRVADASPQTARDVRRRLANLVRGSGVAALLLGIAWLPIQAAELSGATTLAEALQATPIALFHTRFGDALLLRGAMLLLAIGLAGAMARRGRVALALLPAAVAVVAQSWMGHPAAADDNQLLYASIAHVLAAAAWLGALVPLLVVTRGLPGSGAARAAARFSWIGQLAVVVLAITAWLQGVSLIGNEGGLLGTHYGRLGMFKLVLFVVLFLFAVVNRFKISPRLQGMDAARANRHLTASIVIETVIGLLVVLAASWLATGTPGAHEEPDWPFPLRPNWPILDDPLVRNAFIEAAALGLLALILFGRAVLFRRWRWVALAAVPGLIWYANKLIDDAPFLDPILTEANPTSYYFAQGGFTIDSIAHGAQVFAQNCAVCHGADGQADGPAAKALPVQPANLTQEHVWMHSDGQLFWWLTNGVDVPPHGKVMPAWGSILSKGDRWDLVDFIHAHLAGYQMAGKGLWTVPITAPSLAVVCTNGKQFDLGDLKGQFVQIVALGPNDNPPPPSPIQQVLLMKRRVEMPGCVAEGANSWQTYAILAHVPPDQLAGNQFLIDPDGWVRWTLPAKDAAEWADPAKLKATMAKVSASPLASSANPMANMKM